jgi:hypothetical protein
MTLLLVGCDAEEDVEPVHVVAGVETDGVMCLGCRVTILKEIVGHLWGTSQAHAA